MGKIKDYHDLRIWTFDPNGTIAFGQPVGFNGQLAAADAPILGICMEDVDSTHDTGAALTGIVWVTGGGAIAAGAHIKVGTGGKFLTCADADRTAGKNVGRAYTLCSGDNAKFQALIPFGL
jgi:hypothetical protein